MSNINGHHPMYTFTSHDHYLQFLQDAQAEIAVTKFRIWIQIISLTINLKSFWCYSLHHLNTSILLLQDGAHKRPMPGMVTHRMTTGRKVSTLTSHHNIKIKTTYYSSTSNYQRSRIIIWTPYITVSCKKWYNFKNLFITYFRCLHPYLVLPTINAWKISYAIIQNKEILCLSVLHRIMTHNSRKSAA